MLEICFDQGKIKLKDPRLDVIVTYDLRAIRIVGLDCTPPNHIKFGVIMKKKRHQIFLIIKIWCRFLTISYPDIYPWSDLGLPKASIRKSHVEAK